MSQPLHGGSDKDPCLLSYLAFLLFVVTVPTVAITLVATITNDGSTLAYGCALSLVLVTFFADTFRCIDSQTHRRLGDENTEIHR